MKVAFIGHRKIKETEELKARLTEIVTNLIECKGADIFYFGSKSMFDILCHGIVSEIKERYPHVKRIYVRSMYEYIDKSYEEYLLSFYEETFIPDKVIGAGYRAYVMRNQVMIDKSDVLVTYFDKSYCGRLRRNSGTKVAVEYALKKKKRIINLFI